MFSITILLCGYSIFSALVLALSHFNSSHYPEQAQPRYMGILLVLSLAALQAFHYSYLAWGSQSIQSSFYQLLLFSVAPSFYLFSKPLLKGPGDFHVSQLVHAIPVFIAPWLSAVIALPLAFAVGAAYVLWLMHSLYALRNQRSRFHLEITLLGMTFFIALAVLTTGLVLLVQDEKQFFYFYASSIGFAFILINLSINLFPKLPIKIAESAAETYATTTLANIDCKTCLKRLTVLMSDERIYENSKLDLSTLATRINISNHQLSELINTRLGKSFSRYLRENRIEAAKLMLITEPSASVLSIALSIGFTSQSNFYDAFREITDMTPGKYRKITTSSIPQ